jgi:hypothetical protein
VALRSIFKSKSDLNRKTPSGGAGVICRNRKFKMRHVLHIFQSWLPSLAVNKARGVLSPHIHRLPERERKSPKARVYHANYFTLSPDSFRCLIPAALVTHMTKRAFFHILATAWLWVIRHYGRPSLAHSRYRRTAKRAALNIHAAAADAD